jgi:sulfatase maturation enzyme AslB (radical SAM superfamily)
MIIDLTGEVVPCCFWSGYGNAGKPLGNTNINTLDEIWNGPEYQALRRANAQGTLEGHPCHKCVAFQWGNGTYPRFSWPASFVQETGHCVLGQIPEEFGKKLKESGGTAELLEDGRPFSHSDAPHDDIRKLGAGRYSLWGGWLYFSSSDNTDPSSNGRTYELRSADLVLRLASLSADSRSGRNILKAHQEYQAGSEIMEAKPTMISLISTADCNIDCPACSQNTVRLTRVQHRAETVPDVLAHVTYLHQFIWHGGEPYLIKRCREFIDNFKTEDNPNLTFGFTSNGTMLTAKELDKLNKFPRINASISIDSFNKDTFEHIRKGARYEQVLGNYLRALSTQNAPLRVFSCGMIICKSNFLELADNLRFAIEHDIGLNLSPVLIYPVTEQLNLFEDFESQTRGWQSVLDEAREVVARARKQERRAIQRVDPTGMVEELQTIYNSAAQHNRKTVPVEMQVHDDHQSLVNMQRPGIIVFHGSTHEVLSYCELRRGAGKYVMRLPLDLSPASVYWVGVHNLLEPMGRFASGHFKCRDRRDLALPFAAGRVQPALVFAPMFVPVARAANVHFANYGETTPQGLHMRDPEDIHGAYVRLARAEARSGHGVIANSIARRVNALARHARELTIHFAGRTYQILTGKGPSP